MSTTNHKVLIGVAAYDSICVETCASLLSLYRNCKTPVQIRFAPYTYIHVARSALLYQAIDTEATHIMFIDSDMVFPTDGVDRLIAHDKDIVGGLYHKRTENHPAVIFTQIEDKLVNITRSMGRFSDDELFEVDVIGTGFLLIKMDIFKKMEPPFFYYGDPEEFRLKKTPLFDLGEDTTFCLKARKNGYKIFCDPTIKLGHIGIQTF